MTVEHQYELRGELHDFATARPLAFVAQVTPATGVVRLGAVGYGTCNMDAGCGYPVVVEYCDGHLTVLVFADINSEAPTHVIDLGGAAEASRRLD